MPYKSLAEERFFRTDSAAKSGITPAVMQEFDDASKGADMPKHADGPGASHSGMLATHHAHIGAHYRRSGMTELAALHKKIAELHAKHASGPMPDNSIQARATASAHKRGLGAPPETTHPKGAD